MSIPENPYRGWRERLPEWLGRMSILDIIHAAIPFLIWGAVVMDWMTYGEAGFVLAFSAYERAWRRTT